jgi:predicted permease
VGDARARLLLLLGAVILLLVLSCANVANLFMARGVTRTAELAVRSALGATRTRLALQLFGESLLTALCAGAAGGLLGVIGLRVLVAYAPAGIPRLHEVHLDVRALLFVSALTVICAVVFGTLPALRGARAGSAAAAGLRTTAARSAQRFQSGLVALEVAISLVLVTGSALLLNSFMRLLRVDSGFDGDDVVVVDVRPPASADSHARALIFYRTLLERASALPGVAHGALVLTMPGSGRGAWTPVTVENAGSAPATGRSRAPAYGDRPGGLRPGFRGAASPGEEFFRFNVVYGDFLETLDIPLRAGRSFGGNPDNGDALVVMLNETAARVFFAGVDAIGQRLKLGPPDAASPYREVVGIVGDVRQRGSGHDADPQIYVPYGQRDIPQLALMLEVTPGAQVTAETMSSVVRAVAADVPVDRIELLATSYATTADQTRFLTFLISVFAAIGLVLAVVGTYATASHAVSRRIRELGIRIALGARAGAVFGLVLKRALMAAGLGIAGGLLLTLTLARYLESYVYGVTARDPLTVAVAALLIGTCALLASLGPALRAARIEPSEVLRKD